MKTNDRPEVVARIAQRALLFAAFVAVVLSVNVSSAQETVLYSFGATSTDGVSPAYSNLVADSKGNLYGTTTAGGADGDGTVFELTPADGGWTEKILYSFQNDGGQSRDGAGPQAGLVFDAAGNLYGTTGAGGANLGQEGLGAGTVFELSPGAGGTWTEKVLYNFGAGSSDGAGPEASLVFDAAGNLYGTTTFGGNLAPSNDPNALIGGGTVFELTPGTGGTWTEKVLYNFGASATDGCQPQAPVVLDAAGNLYGTTAYCGMYETVSGFDGGTVFELTPAASGPWTEKVLQAFGQSTNGVPAPDGDTLYGGLIFDAAGNLYGTTWGGGYSNSNGIYSSGTVFELSPQSDSSWTETVLHSFIDSSDGYAPSGSLAFDAEGNLYGNATAGGRYSGGAVFELTPQSNGSWAETYLYNFSAPSAGLASYPHAGVILDAKSNIYGTTEQGSAYGNNLGAAYEVTPTAYIIGVSPTSGAVGTVVTITGNRFGATQGTSTVSFNGVAATASEWSNTSIVVTVPPGATSGNVVVSVGGNSGNNVITFTVQVPGYILAEAGNLQSAPVGQTFSTLLVALVWDESSVPLPGVSVTFTAPASGASGTFAGGGNSATVTTDSNGNATAPAYTANSVAGDYVVHATTPGVTGSATFNLDNTAATLPPTAAPVFSPVAGAYASAQSVTITDATQNEVIYYTTDGSTPTTSSTVYGSAILVTSSETVQAVAQAPGDSLSSVSSAAYVINLPAQISLTPGIISTWLKSTAQGSVLGSVAIDSSANIYALDSGSGSITRYNPAGLNPTVIVAAASSPFLNPSDMAMGIDGLTLYVSDYGNNRIVAVNTANSAVTPLTLQGLPVPATLNAPTGIAVGGPNGNVYISDAGNGRVLEFTTSGQFVSVVASVGGSSPLAEPFGLAVDPKGDVFIANDVPNAVGNILEVSGGTITPIANPSIVAPYGLAIDAAGDVYFSDQSLEIVGKLDSSGAVTIVAGNGSSAGDSGDGGPATVAGLLSPLGLALDRLNDIYIADSLETGAGGSVRLVTVGTGALAFASQANGVPAAAQTLTVSNTGGSTLMLNALGALSGANPQDFAIASGNTTGCATGAAFSLGTGVSCALVVTFTPSVTGAESAVLTFNDNSGNGTQTATFTGTGLPPPTLIATTVDLSGPTTLVFGVAGSFVVTVTPASGTGVPTGAIAFSVTTGATQASTGNVNLAGGTASIPISGLAAGNYTIAASYTPATGSGYAASRATAPFAVSQLATTTKLAASSTTAVYYGTTVTLTATVAAAAGGTVPVGSVTFTSGATVLGTGALNGSGVATYVSSSLAVGADSIVAQYTGNIDFTASSSPALSVAISQIPTTTTVASSSLTAATGTGVTFTATVADTSGSVAPSGTVTFSDGGIAFGSGTVTLGAATLSTSSLAAGTHTITAVYSGDTNHAGSTSSALIETIEAINAGFNVVVNPASVTVAQGQTATAVFTVTSIGGYAQPVSFSCSGLPAYATCAFDPAIVVPTSSGVNSTWSLKTNQLVQLTYPFPGLFKNGGPPGSSITLAGGGFAGLVLLLGTRRRRGLLGRFRGSVFLLMFALAATLLSFVSGCGSSGPKTPVGTDMVTISATSGSGSAAVNQTVTLEVTITQ